MAQIFYTIFLLLAIGNILVCCALVIKLCAVWHNTKRFKKFHGRLYESHVRINSSTVGKREFQNSKRSQLFKLAAVMRKQKTVNSQLASVTLKHYNRTNRHSR